MLKHIVMWKFNEEAAGKTKEENLAIVTRELLALMGKVPQLVDIQAGPDVLKTPASYDMALICTFRNVDDMLAYQVNPDHKKVAAYISKAACGRVTADFYTDD